MERACCEGTWSIRRKIFKEVADTKKSSKNWPPDIDSSLLNISVPALVSLNSRSRENLYSENEEKSSQSKRDKRPEMSVSSLHNKETWVPHRRKLGRPKKRVIKEEMPSDTLPLPIKRKRGRPKKIEYKDYDDVNVNPEYVPEGQRHIPPKKPIHYKPAKVYACSQENCGIMFNKWKECKAHERNVHGNEMFRCNIQGCRKMFKTTYWRDQHQSTHEAQIKRRKEGYKCGYEGCERTFITQNKMHRHQRTHTAEKAIHYCPICSMKFISRKRVNKHIKTHNERTHLCDECDKAFKTQKALDRHKRLHTGQGLLVCQFCGKKVSGKCSLDRHERLHTGEKPYKCEFCDKGFVSSGSLQRHKQEHTGYQFVCAQCGHKFRCKSNLLEHERSHTGATPYHCKQCGKYFRWAGNLRMHKQRLHSDKSFICKVCSKAFSTAQNLANHKVVHTGERNYECKYCHKRFGTSCTRSRHVRQVHLGMKRGHQGKGKKVGDEVKRSQQVKQNRENPKNVVTSTDMKAESEPHGSSGRRVQVPETFVGGLPLMMVPLRPDHSRHTGTQPHHQAHGDPSRSDFYSMVDSFIQFSKEH
ncbi:uncharacterized protein [Amphiura filiformis]|uniref:uncharacterized protein n=1 Tax=Amphiura filiformis TaxID=82378 RepID=UPI003B21DC6E